MDPNKDITFKKAEKELKPEFQKPKKKKKHVALKIILTLFVVLIVLPIAAIYICFYDGERSNVKKNESFDINNVLMDAAVDSLDDVNSTHEIDMQITSDDFNQILLNSYETSIGSNATLSQYVTSLYLEATDTNYNFFADVNVFNVFKTRIRIITSFKMGKIDDQDAYIFSIDDIKIGRIGGLFNLAKQYTSNFLNDEFLQGMFSCFGLSFKSDIANNRIYYMLSDVPNDVASIVSSSGDELFSNVLKELFGGKFFSLVFSKDGLSGKINVEKLSKNAEFVDESKDMPVDWSKYKATIREWLNDGIITTDQLSPALEYLIKGAEGYSSYAADDSPLAGKDLTSYDIPVSDYKTYEGIYSVVKKPETDLKQYVQDQINLADIYRLKIASIDEEHINQTLQTSQVIGSNYVLQRKLADGTYKINPMIVTNMYANIYSTGLKITIELNVNECPLYVCVNALYEGFESETYTMTFDLGNVYFGETEASENFKTSIYDIISKGFTNDNSFTFDKDTHKIVAKFDISIDDSGKRSDIDDTGVPDIVLTGETMSDNGKILININPTIELHQATVFPKDEIISHFGTLGETYKDDIISFTSKNNKYRWSVIEKNIEGKSYDAFVVDCDDLDFDFETPETRPLLDNYITTLEDNGFTIGEKKTGSEYTMCYKVYPDGGVSTSGSIVTVGLLQIDDYFQAFYSIKQGDVSEYLPTSGTLPTV